MLRAKRRERSAVLERRIAENGIPRMFGALARFSVALEVGSHSHLGQPVTGQPGAQSLGGERPPGAVDRAKHA
jgi:hypothetical protein